jgi:hypothetical protein
VVFAKDTRFTYMAYPSIRMYRDSPRSLFPRPPHRASQQLLFRTGPWTFPNHHLFGRSKSPSRFIDDTNRAAERHFSHEIGDHNQTPSWEMGHSSPHTAFITILTEIKLRRLNALETSPSTARADLRSSSVFVWTGCIPRYAAGLCTLHSTPLHRDNV